MDLCTLSLKKCAGSPFPLRNPCNRRDEAAARIFEIRFPKPRAPPSSCHGSFVVRAMAKKSNNNRNQDHSSSASGKGDQSLPEGYGPRGNRSSERNKSNGNASQKPHRIKLDWREFRANLFAQEQAEKADTDAHDGGKTPHDSRPLGLKWAHPIPVPETGCVLVATEKLDGESSFERTVVLLLRSGTIHPREGPVGVVINRPLDKKIKHLKPTKLDLATAFSDCSLHFGGPLEERLVLLRSGENPKLLPGLQQVIPGLCFGARNSLHEAAEMVNKGLLKPQDFRFFVGYAGWELDQLKEEIESDYWHVAACSSNLICGASSDSEGLWEEILQLMGGQYSELSRKPKQDKPKPDM